MVGHWTQVVRAEASTVGCWIVTGCQCTAGRSCQKANNGQWSTYMACHYDYGNLGHFPYWPLNPNIQYRMPSTVTQNRRQRCGSCPKGFNQCGTTVGGGEKRDAYLCAGYWNIHESMPPADLLRKSIATRHSATGIPSWYFMVRNCARGNGSCPSNSVCWAYERGKALTAEPPVLVNQCQCKGFSTQYGIYFERDMCGQYSSVQPYYDADAFLTFLEKKKSLDPLPSADALPSADYPQAHTTEGTHLHSVSHPSAARSISTDGAFFQVGTPSEGEAIAQTPPLAETAEEATDLIILPEAQSSPTSIGHALSTHHGVYSMLNQLEDLLSRKTTPLADSVTAFLSVDEITQVKPPSDDLMFEWKNVDDPRSIARKPAHVNADEGSALQVSSNLRGISRHHIKGFSSPAKVTWDKLPSDGPDNIHVAHETLLTGKAISTSHARLAGQDEKFSVSAEEIVQEGPPLPDIVDAKASLGGAVVNVKAVQNEAREKNKTPLPIASEESSSQLHAVSASKGGRRTTQSPQQHLATSTIGFPPRL
ncbi:SCP family extracellular subfamily protein [Besnoitia besnoiti]|uniref:SCP family extracellular subfamily protein n=1 Tax=Besnoitia besnoiti TaxID=94643 RepID=A0A2A9M4Y3_BESBE|nr:SCP family extracellular subfamily protein [Besnoitia besnoiti]PFH31361.1 SCP family extracellular subfamily protein [Besnoitia besnoiti]